VVAQLRTLDPSIARTIANASFMARMPTRTATLHYKRFAQLFSTFHDDVAFARTVAKTASRAMPKPTVMTCPSSPTRVK
jgi:hypothetical protein